jgi:hypothetical protein
VAQWAVGIDTGTNEERAVQPECVSVLQQEKGTAENGMVGQGIPRRMLPI